MLTSSNTTSSLTTNVAKIVSLMDLAGHQKYLKTTMSGLMGHKPQMVIVCMSCKADENWSWICSEHFTIAQKLQLPILIVLTKVDLMLSATMFTMQCILEKLQAVLLPAVNQDEYQLKLIDNKAELDLYFKEYSNLPGRLKIIPILCVSSVTGQGLPLLKQSIFGADFLPSVLAHLPRETVDVEGFERESAMVRVLGTISMTSDAFEDEVEDIDKENDDCNQLISSEDDDQNFSDELDSNRVNLMKLNQHEFAEIISCPQNLSSQLSSIFATHSTTKTILCGKVVHGKLAVHDEFSFGPTSSGEFLKVSVDSIRVQDVPVQVALEGQMVTFCLSLSPAQTNLSFVETGNIEHRARRRGRWRHRSVFAGLVLSNFCKLKAHWEFEAECQPISKGLSLRENTEPVLYYDAIKQSVRVLAVKIVDRDNDSEPVLLCRFRFVYYPEVLVVGETFLLREDRVRAVGHITSCF
jgi:GTPase